MTSHPSEPDIVPVPRVVARRRPVAVSPEEIPEHAPPAPTAQPLVAESFAPATPSPTRADAPVVPVVPGVPLSLPGVISFPAPQKTPAPDLDATSTRNAFGPKYDTLESEHLVDLDRKRITPNERFEPNNAWDMADFGSPVADLGLDAANRLDPYWDGLWGAGSAASWLTADLGRRQTKAGLGRLPAPLNIDTEKAVAHVNSPRGWQQRLALLGSLFSYRTMTAEQAAAMVGDKFLATATAPSVANLFASGVLDLGVFSNGLVETDLTGRGAVYRPGKGDAFDETLKDNLSWPEWCSVTGGQRWAPATNYDRHNILGTELALRLAEFTDIGAVLGERFSSVDLLAGSGIGQPEMVGDQRAADLTAVRSDGMRIVFEMTANTGTHFNKKVEKWAQLLAERPLETSGLTVVFVIVQHPERMADDDGYIPRARTYQAIAAATKQYPGSTRDRVAERMGVATWREWFPARGKVHDAFFTLRVDRPTGPSGAGLWEPADMLDPSGPIGMPFTAHDPEAMTAILDNAALLGQTPFWLRERHDPAPLWPLLLKNAGLTRVPTPSPARPERTSGRPLGRGVGAAGDAKPPRRLLGLTR